MEIPEDLLKICAELKAQRQERGLKLAEVAAAVGIGTAMLSKIENGQYPKVKLVTIFELEAYYNIKLIK